MVCRWCLQVILGVGMAIILGGAYEPLMACEDGVSAIQKSRRQWKSSDASVKYLGEFASSDGCMAACLAYKGEKGERCESFVWHDEMVADCFSAQTCYAAQCYGRLDKEWATVLTPDQNAVSCVRKDILRETNELARRVAGPHTGAAIRSQKAFSLGREAMQSAMRLARRWKDMLASSRALPVDRDAEAVSDMGKEAGGWVTLLWLLVLLNVLVWVASALSRDDSPDEFALSKRTGKCNSTGQGSRRASLVMAPPPGQRQTSFAKTVESGRRAVPFRRAVFV
mmetsp:Transcript_4314/g.10768  ORF Transcript_4314/g.10768 Transcript_4314/m.10768 type:complete len:282 (+) Transcript_4314:53-898(+)